MDKKKIIITKKLNNIFYEMMPKTHADVVYTDKDYSVTLTEKLYAMCELLETRGEDAKDLRDKYNEIVADAPSNFNTFKEVWDYININGDPKSELIKLIESKQAAEPGKGLSTHDFTDYLYAKLKNGYSKEELDNKFLVIEDKIGDVEHNLNDKIEDEANVREDEDDEIKEKIKKHNTFMSPNNPTPDDGVEDGNTWYKLISIDE